LKIITLGVAIFLVGLAGWFIIPTVVISGLNVPVAQGQLSVNEVPTWFVPVALLFQALLVAGAAAIVIGLLRRIRRKPRMSNP
jgi:hypothetical protein